MSRAGASRDYYQLRAEWLRLRSHLHDASSQLPTFAAVLDDVRRLLEERSALGLVFLDLGGSGQLESLHGWQACDDVFKALGAALLGLRGELIGTRDVVAVLAVRSDKFLVFVEASPSLPIDLTSLASLAEALSSRLAGALGERLPHVSGLSFCAGYSVVQRDPMLRAERCVHRALDEAMRISIKQKACEEDHSAQGLDAIVATERVVTLYQPIVDLNDRSVLGHEVFTRGPAGGPFEDPDRLFSLAERTGRLVALERLCRKRAFASLHRHLPPGHKLFLNTSARALQDPEVAGAAFLRQLARSGLRHDDLVLEITERVALEERDSYRDVLHHLKREGVRVAIDDMGAGYSSLQAIVDIEPDYLKFDIELVRNIDRSQIKRSLLETLVELSSKIGADVIAEGIEAESELTTLREMGVQLGQGRHFAAPVMVPEEAAS